MSRRAYTAVGVAAAGGIGYYLYQAGGDTKVARKEAEHDATSAKSRLKGEAVSTDAAKKQGEEWAARAGHKLDNTVNDVKTQFREADSTLTKKAGEFEDKIEHKLDQVKHDSAASFDQTRKDAQKSIEKFDSTVERKAGEAKSGISSWFGFGK